MAKKGKPAGARPARAKTSSKNKSKSLEEQVWEALELAQRQVKHLVEREKQSERLGRDILNLRLKRG